MHPYYIARAFGGLLFLTGALIMAYNVVMTIAGTTAPRAIRCPRTARYPVPPASRRPSEPSPGPSVRRPRIVSRITDIARWPSPSRHLEDARGLREELHHPAPRLFVVVAIGGFVEIAPLFTIDETVETVEGMRPYTPLELAGRNIYIREGCYVCHSQMIRTLRDEVERYGPYSLAVESKYDHPLPVGLEADRPRSRPHRRQVFRRLAVAST